MKKRQGGPERGSGGGERGVGGEEGEEGEEGGRYTQSQRTERGGLRARPRYLMGTTHRHGAQKQDTRVLRISVRLEIFHFNRIRVKIAQ